MRAFAKLCSVLSVAILSADISSAQSDELTPGVSAPGRNWPIVRIESDRPVELEVLSGSAESSSDDTDAVKWRTACESPCESRQPRRGVYRITGDGVMPSEDFSLPSRGRHITLTVSPGSASVRAGAWAVLGIGAALCTAGGIAMAFAPDFGPVDGQNPVLLGGAIPAGIGVTLILTSIPLFVRSRTQLTADAK